MKFLTLRESAAMYPGDDAWNGFVTAFADKWSDRPDTTAYLVSIGIDRPDLAMAKEPYRDLFQYEDLAIVLAGLMGPYALTWATCPVPSFGNKSLLEIHDELEDRAMMQGLRQMIMTMASKSM
jgi:hypothetical protein